MGHLNRKPGGAAAAPSGSVLGVVSKPRRTPLQEALAAVVREASGGAVEALYSAAPDRRRVHEREWDRTNQDTLADLEMLDDKLQGAAAWVLAGRPHPHEDQLASELETLHHQVVNLQSRCADFQQLQNYLSRLQVLRTALIDYFNSTPEQGKR